MLASSLRGDFLFLPTWKRVFGAFFQKYNVSAGLNILIPFSNRLTSSMFRQKIEWTQRLKNKNGPQSVLFLAQGKFEILHLFFSSSVSYFLSQRRLSVKTNTKKELKKKKSEY